MLAVQQLVQMVQIRPDQPVVRVMGNTGLRGLPGDGILSGAGAPALATGNVGQFYIDTTARAMYGPKTVIGWGAGTSMFGPKGDKGDPGSFGEGFGSRGALAAVAAPVLLDDAYLTEGLRAGKFIFYTAAGYNAIYGRTLTTDVAGDPEQGVFIAKSTDATGASGAWVRQYRMHIHPDWFSGSGDATSILAALAFDKAMAINVDGGMYKGGAGIWIDKDYVMGTTSIDVTHTTAFDGPGSVNGYRGRLIWTGDCDGVRVQAQNTTGVGTVDGTPHFSGSYTRIRGIGLIGPYANSSDFTGHTEGEFHAVRAHSNLVMDDYFIDGWAGDGIYAHTSVGGGGSEEGNSNCSFLRRGKITNCRDLINIDGADGKRLGHRWYGRLLCPPLDNS
jgi:hypothetical protein